MQVLAWFVALFWPIGVAGTMTAIFIAAMFAAWKFFDSKIGRRFCEWLFDEQPTQAFSFIRVKYILFNEGGIHMKSIISLTLVAIGAFFFGATAMRMNVLEEEVTRLKDEYEPEEEESE